MAFPPLRCGTLLALVGGLTWLVPAEEPTAPTERDKLLAEAKQLHDQGVQLHDQGKLPDARARLTRAVELYQKADASAHLPLIQAMIRLGSVCEGMGDFQQAVQHLEQAVALARKLNPADRLVLAEGLTKLAYCLKQLGRPEEGLPHCREALALHEKLYPASEHPDGHEALAGNLDNLGTLLWAMGDYHPAVPVYERALQMRLRLYEKSKSSDALNVLARTLNNLGTVWHGMGEYRKALTYFEQATQKRRQLFPEDRFPNGNPYLLVNLNNVGQVLLTLGEYDRALPYFEQALAMSRKLYPASQYPDGHPNLAMSLDALGGLLTEMHRADKGIIYEEEALKMVQRLFPDERFPRGHPLLALVLSNVAYAAGKAHDAERSRLCYDQAVAMNRTLYPREQFPRGHPALARALTNQAMHLYWLKRYPEAVAAAEQALDVWQRLYPERHYPHGHPELGQALARAGRLQLAAGRRKEAFDQVERGIVMWRRLADSYLVVAPEAEALSYLQRMEDAMDLLLATAEPGPEMDPRVYRQIWATKAYETRILQRRHEATQRAVARSEEVRRQWERLLDVRLQLSQLLVLATNDLAGRDRRLQQLTEEKERLERALAATRPMGDESKPAAELGPDDLGSRLPPGTVFLDFVRQRAVDRDAEIKHRYQVFLVAPGGVIRCIDLGPAQPIDAAVAAWRAQIDALEEGSAGQSLRRLVWDRLAPHLPDGTRTIYLAPDGSLARVPFIALPGARPGTVLLEDYQLAVVPHGPFLLDHLARPSPPPAPGDRVLAVGGVRYDVAGPSSYAFLPGTVTEQKQVQSVAGERAVALGGADATVKRLVEDLPRSRFAHLATHGFFDSERFHDDMKRRLARLDEWRFQPGRATVLPGLGERSPLAYTGLVLAPGSARKEDAGTGILSGEALVELPLEKLELVTLSACETGLGTYTGAEGVNSLTRAFHLAGCPNAIASLWKVNDAATAALMAQLYHELWVNKKAPLEALREAQLTIYRHPERIEVLAGERGRPALESAAKLGSALVKKPNDRPKTTPTKLWAAFVLSGVGR
jgi:CHAT domain-containing protein/tetratricopeptide (TPR) repeat protein